LFKRALVAYQKTPWAESAVATLLNNLGQVCNSEGRYAEAEPPIKQSLTIREKLLGRDHIGVARAESIWAISAARPPCRGRAGFSARAFDP